MLVELCKVLAANPTDAGLVALGRLSSHIIVLRRLSRSVAGLLQNRENPALQAALVNDMGSVLQQEIPETTRQTVTPEPGANSTRR